MHAFDIPNLSLVCVTGSDAIKVLNGLCTAKLVDLKGGQATEAMFTDDRGRVLAHCMLALAPNTKTAWIVGQYATPDKLAAHIDRFIFREDAQPKDLTSQGVGLIVDCESNAQWMEAAQTLGLGATECGTFQLHDQPVWYMPLPITSPNARLFLVPAARRVALLELLGKVGCVLGAQAEFEDRRIRNFWPSLAELNEKTLPQELDRDQRAISFTKGCYLGQETVARLDAMGQVQKKLCLVELYGSEKISAGQTLVSNGKEVGQLNSVSPVQHAEKRFALATMRRGSMAAGSPFDVVSLVDGQARVSGEVVGRS